MATTMPQKLLWLQGLRLSTKLTIAYTVIVMLVAGILAWVSMCSCVRRNG